MEIIHKNYKSDFDAILHLKSCVGDVCKEIGWPDYDWVAKFYTTSHDNVYIASNVGGVLTNCFDDNGNIHVVFNNHGLPSGTLRVEFSAEIPNEIYPDGSQLEVSPQSLNIELVRGVGDCGTIADVEVMLSFIKGDKGDAFTYEDFTAEQIAELQRPATEAAESVSRLEEEVSQAEALRASAEQTRKANEQSRISAENGRVSGENERKANEIARQDNEATRIANENERQQNEESRVSAETARAEEFATWEEKIDSKQDALTTSEDLSISAFNELSLTDMAKKRLFIDMWNKAAGFYGTYNAETGCFELNGLTDITYDEAMNIFRTGIQHNSLPDINSMYSYMNIRTNLHLFNYNLLNIKIHSLFSHCQNLEVANVGLIASNAYGAFRDCPKLKKILGPLSLQYKPVNDYMFLNCMALEEVQIQYLRTNISFSDSPLLSLISLKYMVQWGGTTSPITITVHPDVYAKLTGDATNEVAGALTAEELAQWQQLVTDAAAKQISFATV